MVNKLSVTSEIGTLKRLLVHSPDSGIGKVVPSKAQDWLFEDIVHLDTIRRDEYDYYTKILLYFLDPAKIKGRLAEIDAPENKRNFYKPEHADFYRSDKVIELEWLLADILENYDIRVKLVASVTAIESCTYQVQKDLLTYSPGELAKLFISGTSREKQMLFAPIPNFIFTRDIGITIGDHVLLNKPAKKARTREALLAKYIFFHHPFFEAWQDNIIELPDYSHSFLLPEEEEENRKITLEGGDIMVISSRHLLVGVSERTSPEAAVAITGIMFEKGLADKVTIIRIPRKRDYMHIDTVFTQVKKDVWVMLGNFSRKTIKHEDEKAIERLLEVKKEEKIKILQFHKDAPENPVSFESLEDLLADISRTDLHCKGEVRFIFSGNNEFPYNAREQWTDSCNLLALKEGVVLGYDRNDKTTEAFREAGFSIVHVEDLLPQLEAGTVSTDSIKDTLILMPSAELSRARGGFHCMSMPLWREELSFSETV
ncbi:arginine deiminase family protein [Sediminibacterium ginsengisoli]|uniref:arginine deiminase n=1 Tax=Sediminibacterium ginsengisoli TaxID=413434 RepID=A0A1T4PNY0_9BACT|nr:arginine deiminase family protein [Sediminibacterium ginsengisoli]SJZ93315.1 arginine deiminase [Sediminibacterium ginsengisoli]